jgi:hypothetical protein
MILVGVCFMIVLLMDNDEGAWDNAKKLIEQGEYEELEDSELTYNNKNLKHLRKIRPENRKLILLLE